MMRKRFGVPLVLLALFLGVSLIGWAAVFAADQRYISIDTVEKKVDCISGYLEDVHNMFVPNDFKPTLMGQIEPDEKGFVETEIVDDPTAATNDIVLGASQAALGASPSPENFLVLTAFVGVLTGDEKYADYTDERCDIAEAYEEPYESEIAPVAREGDYEPFDPDPPDEEEEEDGEEEEAGWIYYGKEYDRDEITDRAATRSTNGVLYMDDDIIQLSESEFRTYEEYGEGGIDGYGGYHYSQEVTKQGSMIVPPMIMPHMVLGYGGYGGEYENDEGYGFEQSLSGSDLIAEGIMPAPTVDIVEGQYYRYTWAGFGDGEIDAVQESEYAPSFSATLYDDHTIMFDYNRDMLIFPPELVEGKYWPEIMVGLHPGTIESWDYAATETDYYGYGGYPQGSSVDVHRDVCTSIGGENMPGAGQPRSDYYTYWENMNLSQQYGRPLDDIYDENGNLCWLPISETFYDEYGNNVGSTSMPMMHGFDLRDRFIIFEDFQMVADWVDGPEGPDEPYNQYFGYGGFENFHREDTPHKYTATTGSHDMVVDIDSLDEARAMVIENPDLLMEIHDFYTILENEKEKVFIDDDNNEHIVYSRAIKHGAFKPGCYDSCHFGNGEGYAPDGTVLADPEFPGIERWPVAWTNYGDYGDASEFNNYKYGLQTVGYGGYYSNPVCFTSGSHSIMSDGIEADWGEWYSAMDRINSSGFLAYAVQVEEDIVNRKILDLQTMRAGLESIKDARQLAGIRARDAFFTQEADAQSGRVTRDQHGNWVRAQQYVLRSPDKKSVQVVNASMRNGSDISSMVFTTNFAGENGFSGDLTKLPWGPWLDTQTHAVHPELGRHVITTLTNLDGTPTPELAGMSVEFRNSAGDSLAESRDFQERILGYDPVQVQRIDPGSELLAINGTDYAFDAPSGNSYTVAPRSYGFDYVLSGGDSVNVAFYDAEDGDRGLNTEAAVPMHNYAGEGEYRIEDMWDALGVTQPRWVQAPQAQLNGNLEIAISNGPITQPIDVIYIPMSRMLWKSEPS